MRCAETPVLQADCVVLELEDGVALSAKTTARQNCVKWLNERGGQYEGLQCHELGLRVNSLSSGLLDDDLDVSMRCPKF